MAKKGGRNKAIPKAETYKHPEADSPLRPEVGTQPQFKKKKPPQRYQYDSSLSPALDWDGQNWAREQGEWLLSLIAEAAALPAPHLFEQPRELIQGDGKKVATVLGLQDAIEQLQRLSQPFLNWAGKAERLSFDVPTLPLFVHERLSTKGIIETLRGHKKQKGEQLELFGDPQHSVTDQVLKAYEYRDKWVNRLILGDSLVVMNSLLHYEGLGGQVQMIYLDPPYGIKFGSNFQPFVRKRDVKHNDDEDFTREPEMVKAYRDTWEVGLHSYLTYLRDRLLLCRDLLAPSGSIFVQISDENLHHVREILGEVFGIENFISVISFRKTTGQSGSLLSDTNDYLLWYAKNKISVKFRPLFMPRSGFGWVNYDFVATPDGIHRKMTRPEMDNPELLPLGSRVYRRDNLTSASKSETTSMPVLFQGKTYLPGKGGWKTNEQGFANLVAANRLEAYGITLSYRRYAEDFPFFPVSNAWTDTASGGYGADKIYVVQTNLKVIERCLLMTTDPGDLVLDPTCVRRGTKVLTPLNPPVNKEKATPLNPPVNGGTLKGGATLTPSPLTGRVGEGFFSPLTGRVGEGYFASGGVGEVPIESIKPGDYVFGHDGQPHRVVRIMHRPYKGTMIGLRHSLCPRTLWLTSDHLVLCAKRTSSYGAERSWKHIPQRHFGRGRELRSTPTEPEKRLWQILRGEQMGVKFRRQHPLGPYFADFYSWQAGLVVEVDGDSHYTPAGQNYDAERTAYLEGLGLTVRRYSNLEVMSNLEGVVSDILDKVAAVRSSVNHYREWRRADTLRWGDVVFFGPDLQPVDINYLEEVAAEEEVFDLEVENVHSFLTEVCVVHNCGSGTTAYVAEHWGRRWITADVSRVPLALARQRLLTATFPYYQLQDEDRGPVGGFVYKRKQNKKGEEIGGIVPHITLKSIANNEPPEEEVLVDRPEMINSVTRVTGPFCVEATIPAPLEWETESTETQVCGGPEDHGSFDDRMLEVLRKSPVLHVGGGQTVTLKQVRPPAKTLSLSAEALVESPTPALPVNGEKSPSPTLPVNGEGVKVTPSLKVPPLTGGFRGVALPVALVFGPENGAVSEKLVYEAAREAHGKNYVHLYVIGFAIQPNARKLVEDCEAVTGIPATYVQATPDLMMGDLLKNMRSSQIFSVCGLPEVKLAKLDPDKKSEPVKYQAELLGLDVFDPATMETLHRRGDDVPAWFLDTDYNGLCFHVCQAFFPRTAAWENLKKALKGLYDDSVWDHLAGTVSAPFEAGEHGQVAVKVVDDRGNELLVVKSLKEAQA